MGSSGPDGSAVVALGAIREVNPRSVIAAGIAFGRSPKKQPIGTFLISSTLSCYELQRIGQRNVVSRGPQRLPASPRLLSRFRLAASLGQIPAVEGEVLSGDKLVDDPEFKSVLFDRYPEAIGGEMEASGVHAAAAREGIDWIVIKAVCDHAEKKSYRKADRQKLAVKNATKLILAAADHRGLTTKR